MSSLHKVLSAPITLCRKMTNQSTGSKNWQPEDHVPKSVRTLLARKHPNHLLAFMNVVQHLKLQRRTGWVDHDIDPCESIADHMYRMGVTSMLIRDPKVNRDKCVRIALVHDIAEALVGDITPFSDVSKEEKHRREWETMQYICEELIKPYNETAAQEIMDHWLEYENISSLEARYVKDIDKYEMLVQAYEYEVQWGARVDLDQFWSARSSIKTEEVTAWAEDLYTLRGDTVKPNKV